MVDTEESRFSKETMIQVDKSTTEQLRTLDKKGELYNDIVQRLQGEHEPR